MHIFKSISTNNKEKGEKSIINLIVILCLFSIQSVSIDALSFLSTNFLLAIVIILVLNRMVLREKVLVSSVYLWLILCFFMMILSTLLSVNFSASLQYTAYYILYGLILIMLSNETGWQDVCLKTQYLLSMTNVTITILSSIFPLQYLALVLPMYSDINQNFILYWVNHNNYPGIAGQLGTNAFIITIGIAITLSNILSKEVRKNKIQIFLLLTMIYALFLTGKRGMLIGNIIAILITWYAGPLTVKRGRIFKVLLLLIVIVITLYILSMFVPVLNQTLGRFSNNWGGADFSSGRLDLYKNSYTLFKEHLLIGQGINSYTLLNIDLFDTSGGSHNDLLQIMVETGIIGTLIFIIPIIWILKNTLKLIRYTYSDHYIEASCQQRNYLLASLYVQIIVIYYSIIGNPFHYYNILFIYMIFAAIGIAAKKVLK